MPNNIAVSITADVADLQVKRAILSAELKAAQKDLNDFARTAKASGTTSELRTSMLASADAVSRVRNQIGLLDREAKSLSAGAAGAEALAAGTGEAAKAMGGLHVGTAGVTRELIVLAREAGRGNFSRMAGSATILAQRLGLLTPEVLLAGVAIAALVAPIVAVEAAVNSVEGDLAKFQNEIQLTGNYAGLTATQYEDMARRLGAASNTGVGKARSDLLALVTSGRFTGEEINQLGFDVERFSQLTGESTKQVLAEFIKMADGPTRFAEEFSRQYHGAISLAQLEHIKNLEDEGQKSEATAALVQDLTHWLQDQTVHMSGLAGAWHGLSTAIDNAWESWKRFNTGPTQGEDLARKQAQLKSLQTTGTVDGDHFYGADRAQMIATLQREIGAIQAKAAADRQAADAAASAARTQEAGTEAYEKSHQTFLSLRSSADQAREAVKALNDEMAARLKANPNDAEAKDYEANRGRYDAALERKLDPGDFKKKGGKGPDQVSEWAEQLHQQEVASRDFFGDQTQTELDFWNKKKDLVAEGSKDYLAIQAKIYELEKKQAHDAYDDQLATLNEQISAQRDNWSKEEALWNQKLALIKSNFGEQSKEYKDAQREEEAAEREHQHQLAQIQREGAQEALAELKSNLDASKAVRDANARTAETGIQANATGTPIVGEVLAAQQIAALHKQMNAQELADEEQLHAAKDAILQQEIATAAQAYGTDSAQYIKAVNEKKLADVQWANQLRTLSAQATARQAADQQKIAAAWHSRIDPLVNSVGTQFQGLINHTETWRQALLKIGESIEGVIIQAIEKMAAEWIVNAVIGQTAQVTSAQAGIQAAAALAGANGVASFAAAPYPIDLGAPGFGAAMAAAAQGFSLGGFEKGLDVVPNDMIAQIHEGERIVPKADNAALIAAVQGGGGGGGTTNITNNLNHAPVINGAASQSVVKQLESNKRDFARLLRGMARDGHFKAA